MLLTPQLPPKSLATNTPAPPPLRVLLVGNYAPDRQQSMLRFAEMLRTGFLARGIQVETLEPRAHFGGRNGAATFSGIGKWLAYADKYLRFPRELRQRIRELRAETPDSPLVVHICDHSNAVYAPHARAAAANCAIVVTCHDLGAVRGAFGEARETFCPASSTGRILQGWIRRSLGHADLVACDSAATESDVRRLVRAASRNSEPPATRTILIGLNFKFQPVPAALADARLARLAPLGFNPEKSFLLHVGSSLPRKNRDGVLRAYVRMLTQGWRGQLVFAGEALPPDLQVLAAGINASGVGHILQLVNPDNDLLAALYSRALALLFPSRFEGFGWPVIEAQACGCPVLCSADAPALAEVAGAGALLAPAEDADAFAAHASQLARDPAERARWIERGFANLRRFDTDQMLDNYLAAYRDALGISAQAAHPS